MKLMEKYEHNGKGYNPFIIRSKWQVAQLNHSPEVELETISCLDVHHKTDEVFFLINGAAVLIAAEIVDGKIFYDLQLMKPEVTYNIPRNVWHKIAMKEGAKVLIVEDSNTHLPLPDGDYEFYYLSEQQKADLKEQVSQLLEEKADKDLIL